MQLSIEQIGIFLAAISVVIGVILGIDQARDMKRARFAELFMEFQSQAFNLEFLEHLLEINATWSWTNSDDFFLKYGPESNPQAFAKFITVGTFFDSMGVLLKNKLIDIKMVPELMAIAVLDFWSKVGPVAGALAKAMQRPQAFENIEFLYQKIRKTDRTLGNE